MGRKRPNAKNPSDRTPCCHLISVNRRDAITTYICSRPNNHYGRHAKAYFFDIPQSTVEAFWKEGQIEKGNLDASNLPVVVVECTNSKDYENV